MQAGKFSKNDKRAGGNKAVQVGIFQKSIEGHAQNLLQLNSI